MRRAILLCLALWAGMACGTWLQAQSSHPIFHHGRAEILRAGHLQFLDPEGRWQVDATVPELPMTLREGLVYHWDGERAYCFDNSGSVVVMRSYELVEGLHHRRTWSFAPPVHLPERTYPLLVDHGWAICSHPAVSDKPHPPFDLQLLNLYTFEATTLGQFSLTDLGMDPLCGILVDGDMYLIQATGSIQVLRAGSKSLEQVTFNFWDSVSGLETPPTKDGYLHVSYQGAGVTSDGRVLVPIYGTLPCDRGWAEAAFQKMPPARQAQLIREGHWPLPEGPLPWKIANVVFVAFDLASHRQAFIPFAQGRKVLTHYEVDGGWRFSTDLPPQSRFWMDRDGDVDLIPVAEPPVPAPAPSGSR